MGSDGRGGPAEVVAGLLGDGFRGADVPLDRGHAARPVPLRQYGRGHTFRVLVANTRM